jgi:hypothetical protein
VYGLRDIHGSDSLRVKGSFDMVSPADGNQAMYPGPDSGLMERFGVRYVMTERTLSEPWHLAYDGEVRVYESTQARPRGAIGGEPRSEMLVPEVDRKRVTFVEDGPDRIVMTVKGVVEGGHVTIADSAYPGWRAFVDGKPTPMPKTEPPLRAVHVGGGEHIVEFRYEPATYRVGLFVSLLALGVLLGFGTACFVSSRRSAAATAA